jgi:hypothetical protein
VCCLAAIADGVPRDSESETAAEKRTGSSPASTPGKPHSGPRLALVERHRFRAGLLGFGLWGIRVFLLLNAYSSIGGVIDHRKMAWGGRRGGYPPAQAVGVVKRKVARIQRCPEQARSPQNYGSIQPAPQPLKETRTVLSAPEALSNTPEMLLAAWNSRLKKVISLTPFRYAAHTLSDILRTAERFSSTATGERQQSNSCRTVWPGGISSDHKNEGDE